MVYIATRPPVAAGQFYEDNRKALTLQIKDCFASRFGPGELPEKKGKLRKMPAGAVVPHAGYAYSGPCAAHVYKKLARSKKPDSVVIMGPSHSGSGKVPVWRGSAWETPFGKVDIDKRLAKDIVDTSNVFDSEPMPHMQEHSLEVQVPFLQYIYGDDLKIVPIIVAPEPSVSFCKRVGESLAQAVKDAGQNVVVLASSDFTHYGVRYGYMPFVGTDVRDKIEELDKKAIDKIASPHIEKYIKYLEETKATICGRTAIGCLIAYLKAMGASKGKLLKYYMSGDITGGYTNSVSYASILFK